MPHTEQTFSAKGASPDRGRHRVEPARPFALPSDERFETLLRAARGGDSNSLGRLLQSFRDYLLLVARRELATDLQSKVGPSDVVQDTFLQAQHGFAAFQGQTAVELAAWLQRMLRHNLVHCARRYRLDDPRGQGREVALAPGSLEGTAEGPLVAETPTPSKWAMAQEREELLRQALARLPEAYQQVIVLRHREGGSFEEIGRALQRSSEAARKLWGRAIQQLQRELASS
jgi:RNA polymerase sigma-70 factor (ECF subfamily)